MTMNCPACNAELFPVTDSKGKMTGHYKHDKYRVIELKYPSKKKGKRKQRKIRIWIKFCRHEDMTYHENTWNNQQNLDKRFWEQKRGDKSDISWKRGIGTGGKDDRKRRPDDIENMRIKYSNSIIFVPKGMTCCKHCGRYAWKIHQVSRGSFQLICDFCKCPEDVDSKDILKYLTECPNGDGDFLISLGTDLGLSESRYFICKSCNELVHISSIGENRYSIICPECGKIYLRKEGINAKKKVILKCDNCGTKATLKKFLEMKKKNLEDDLDDQKGAMDILLKEVEELCKKMKKVTTEAELINLESACEELLNRSYHHEFNVEFLKKEIKGVETWMKKA